MKSHNEKAIWKIFISKKKNKKDDESFRTYEKQKNYCNRLYIKEHKKFFNKINPSFVKDNKLFWKTVQLFYQIQEIVEII